MENVRIYLAGGMSALSIEEQTKWRNRFRDAVKYGNYELLKNPIFFSPPDFYSMADKEYKSEREIMEFDLYNLRRSNLVVVNFNAPNSIGTAMELAIAKENKIPVIGLNQENVSLHPWFVECTTRMCDTFKELIEHVVKFYLA